MSTYVLVHGAGGRGEFWAAVVPHLEALGHTVVVVEQQPSAGTDPASLGDLPDDVANLRRIVDGLGNAPDDGTEHDVVLVGHSYGGMAVTELAAHPAVRHSIYLGAFLPTRGQSAMDVYGQAPPPTWWAPRADGTAAITDDPDVAAAALWHDADAETAARAHARLQLQSLAPFGTPSSAPDRTHPATYVVCEQDRAAPVELQEQMARRADHVLRIDTSHCPMLSAPRELAAVLDHAVVTARAVASSH